MDQLIIKPKVYKYPLIKDLVKDLKPPNMIEKEEGNSNRKTINPAEFYLTRDNFQYFHYGCDNANDHGWGCAYRSMQSMCSWILHHNNITNNNNIPSIKEAQHILVNIGDKPASFVGSHEWIGALEIAYIIEYLYQVPSKIVHVPHYEKLINYIKILKDYFREYGGFIMMGDDTNAASKGIAGLYTHHDQSYLLVVDPHFAGTNVSIQKLLTEGYVRWQNVNEFNNTSFYNICLPCI